MTKILIADACKPSLVMSSEVFKDKIPGALVFVAASGRECLDKVEEENPDLILVDFDLPDVDGATLITALRKIYNGPILLTAFTDTIVGQAVNDLLFAFNDASSWVPKPVKFNVLSEKIEQFLLDGKRLGKRFEADLQMQLIAKAAGRGKRAPKVTGIVENISLGGARIRLDGPMKLKKFQEMTVSISFPTQSKTKKAATKKLNAKATKVTKASRSSSTTAKQKVTETKIKVKVAWASKDEVGLQFGKLSEIQRKGIESFLRSSVE